MLIPGVILTQVQITVPSYPQECPIETTQAPSGLLQPARTRHPVCSWNTLRRSEVRICGDFGSLLVTSVLVAACKKNKGHLTGRLKEARVPFDFLKVRSYQNYWHGFSSLHHLEGNLQEVTFMVPYTPLFGKTNRTSRCLFGHRVGTSRVCATQILSWGFSLPLGSQERVPLIPSWDGNER